MNQQAIELRQVCKRFGKMNAVVDVDLQVEAGKVIALAGPNGAGKSTLIKMILGFFPPTTGAVRVLGVDPLAAGAEFRQRVGYVPEHHHFFDSMTVHQLLKFSRMCYRNWSNDHCDKVATLLALPRDRKAKQLSRGELAKVALTIALAHKPPLLILDEPTSGLDPLVRAQFVHSAASLVRDSGSTVLFSTHILSDVEQLADDVMVMAGGRLVVRQGVNEFKNRYSRAVLMLAAPRDDAPMLAGAVKIDRGRREWRVVFDGKTQEEVREVAASIQATVEAFEPVTLDEAFILLAGVPLESAEAPA